MEGRREVEETYGHLLATDDKYDHATGQCKAKRWFAVNFGKVKLAAMAMVNLAREIA